MERARSLALVLVGGVALVGAWAWSRTRLPQPAATVLPVLIVQPSRANGARMTRHGQNGIGVVELLSGKPPAPPETAMVLTDANCLPDPSGISHCINRLGLANGVVVTVRHDHNMALSPCLLPGQPVFLRSASSL